MLARGWAEMSKREPVEPMWGGYVAIPQTIPQLKGPNEACKYTETLAQLTCEQKLSACDTRYAFWHVLYDEYSSE